MHSLSLSLSLSLSHTHTHTHTQACTHGRRKRFGCRGTCPKRGDVTFPRGWGWEEGGRAEGRMGLGRRVFGICGSVVFGPGVLRGQGGRGGRGGGSEVRSGSC